MRVRWQGLLVAGIAPAILGTTSPEPSPKAQAEQAERHEATRGSVSDVPSADNKEAKGSQSSNNEGKPCQPGEDKRNSDLCAQWKAADAAADAAWWAAFSGWFGGLSFIGVLAALGIGYHANRIARLSMEAQVRPWIKVEIDEVLGFRTGDASPHFRARLRFTNTGSTPAIGMAYFMAFSLGEPPRVHLDETIAMFEDGRIAWEEANMFPRDPLERLVSCEHTGALPPTPVHVGFYVVAAYRTPFSKRRRYTALVHRILDLRRDDELVDFSDLPSGDHVRLRVDEHFIGYAT